MIELATFTTTDAQGKEVLIRCDDVRRATEHPNGSEVLFMDGGKSVVSMSISSMQTAIDAKWDELITAITG